MKCSEISKKKWSHPGNPLRPAMWRVNRTVNGQCQGSRSGRIPDSARDPEAKRMARSPLGRAVVRWTRNFHQARCGISPVYIHVWICIYIYYIVLYYLISYYFISNTISYHIILYYIVLYCIALYNILYCIILYDSVNIYITILYIGLILDFLNHLPSLSGMHIVPIDWFRRGIRQETIVFTPQIVARSCLPLHQLWASWTDPYPWKIIMGNMMWMSSGWIPKANTSPRFWSVSHWFCHHETVHQICRSQASCYIV